MTSVCLCRHMSAVCVYTIQDIDKIFKNSPFKGTQAVRPRTVRLIQIDQRGKM